MIFDMKICDNCIAWQRNKDTCPYRNMSLLQYCDYKNIPYTWKKGGSELWIDTSNLMNGSAMIELKKEVLRTRNEIKETGWDYMVVV